MLYAFNEQILSPRLFLSPQGKIHSLPEVQAHLQHPALLDYQCYQGNHHFQEDQFFPVCHGHLCHRVDLVVQTALLLDACRSHLFLQYFLGDLESPCHPKDDH